jgi:hypothetical protein
VGVLKQTLCFAFHVFFLFGRETAWTKTGLSAVKHLGEKVEKPEDDERHIKNVTDLSMLGTVNIASSLSKAYRQQTNTYSDNVKKTRYCLKIDRLYKILW